MILSTYISLKVSPTNIKHWRNLGYNADFCDDLLVPVDQLPEKARTSVLCRCDTCSYEWMQRYAIANKACSAGRPCNRKYIGQTMNKINIIRLAKSRVGELNGNWKKDTHAFLRYKRKVIKLTEREYEKYIDWINPNHFPRTLCGVVVGFQLDHKLPIRKAFDLGLSPEIISRFHNLQMLRWEANVAKGCCINKRKGIKNWPSI